MALAGTAFVNFKADFSRVAIGARKAGTDAGDEVGNRFNRGVSGKLRETRSLFARQGKSSGSAYAQEAVDQFGGKFKRDVNGKLRNSRGQFVDEGKKAGGGFAGGVNDGSKRGWSLFSRSGAKAGKDAGKGASSGFLGSFKGIASAGAVLGGVKLFGDFISEARESAKVGRITENVIRATGGVANITSKQVSDLSMSISNKTGIDDEQIQTAENMLLTFKNVRNEAGKNNDIFNRATQATADLSVQFGGMDGASKQLGKALNDPIKGVSALGRAGVTFSQTQKDQIKNFVATGDLLSAQKIVLGEVESQVGGAAAAAADPMQKLGVIVGNLKERIGTALLPVISSVATWLGDNLPRALDFAGKAFSWLGSTLAPVVGWFRSVGPAILSGIGAAFTWLTATAIPAVVGAVRSMIAGFQGVGGGFFGSLGAGARVVFNWITQTAIPGIRNAISSFLAGISGASSGGFFGTLGEKARTVFDWIVGTAIPGIRNAIGSFLAGLQGVSSGGFFGSLGEKARVVFDWITQTAIPGIRQAIGSFLAGLQGDGGSGSFFTALGNAIRGVAHWAGDVLIPAIARLVPVFSGLVGFIRDNLKPILIGLGVVIGGLVLTLGSPVVAVATLVAAFVWAYQKFGWFRDGVGIVFTVVSTIIRTAVNIIIGLFENVIGPAIGVLVGLFQTVLLPAIKFVWSVIGTVIGVAWTIVKGIFTAISWTVTNVLIPVFNGFLAVAKFVWGLVWAVIRDAWEIMRPIIGAIALAIAVPLVGTFKAFQFVAAAVWGAVHGAVTEAWSVMSPVFSAIVGFVRDKLTPVWRAVSDAVAAAFGAIPGAIGAALRAAGNLVAGFMRGAAGIAAVIGLDHIAGSLRKGADQADSWGEGGGGPSTALRRASRGGAVPLAAGGVVPFVTNGPRAIVGEGDSRFPEYVIPTDPKYRDRARALWQQAGPQLLASGGIIGSAWDKAKSIGGSILGKLRSIAAGGLEKIWPKLPEGKGLLGMVPGGANYLRSGVIGLIRGEAAKKDSAMSTAPSGGGSSGGPPNGSYPGGAGAAAAKGWITQALNILNLPVDAWLPGLMRRANQESGYNPRAQNNWDINARRGIPSKGFLQTIDPTFRQYAVAGHGDIWNPVDNTLAAIRYMQARYGSVNNLPTGGYASGGVLPVSAHARNFDTGGTLKAGWNLVNNETGGPEHVAPVRQAPVIGEAHFHDGVDLDLVLQKVDRRVRAGRL